MALTLDEIDRYHRQMLLPEWGAAGQERVRAARVLLEGNGAAAEAAQRYLAGAGVGTIERGRVAASADGPCSVLVGEEGVRLVVPGDREAIGCACALEALKALLGLPHHACPSVPLPGAS